MSEPRIIQTEPITHRGGVPLRRIVAAIIGRKQRTVRLDCGHTALVRDRRTQWWPCAKCGPASTRPGEHAARRARGPASTRPGQ